MKNIFSFKSKMHIQCSCLQIFTLITCSLNSLQLLSSDIKISGNAYSGSSNYISWTDTSKTTAVYYVLRASDGISFHILDSLDIQKRDYIDDSLASGTAFSYIVWAKDLGGNISRTDTVEINTGKLEFFGGIAPISAVSFSEPREITHLYYSDTLTIFPSSKDSFLLLTLKSLYTSNSYTHIEVFNGSDTENLLYNSYHVNRIYNNVQVISTDTSGALTIVLHIYSAVITWSADIVNVGITMPTLYGIESQTNFRNKIAWKGNSGNEVKYIIESSLGEYTPFHFLAELISGEEYIDSKYVVPNTPYFYRIKAISSSGDTSIYSKVQSIFTGPVWKKKQNLLCNLDLPYSSFFDNIVIHDTAYFAINSNEGIYSYDASSDSIYISTYYPENSYGSELYFSLNDKFYLGMIQYDRKNFWEYNPTNKQWGQKADFLSYRGNGISISTPQYGLYTESDSLTAYGSFSTGNICDDLYRYDPFENKWTKTGSFPRYLGFLESYFIHENDLYTLNRSAPYVNVLKYNAPLNTFESTDKTRINASFLNVRHAITMQEKTYVPLLNGDLTLGNYISYEPATKQWNFFFGPDANYETAAFVIKDTGYFFTPKTGNFWSFSPALFLQSPTTIAAEAVSDHEINLFWDDDLDAEFYLLERSLDNTDDFVPIARLNTNVFHDTTLSPEQKAYYRTRKCSASSSSSYSNIVSATTFEAAQIINGVTVEQRKNFRIFPNPGTGVFIISFGEKSPQENVKIEIYSLNGTLVKSISRNAQLDSIQFDISELPMDEYLVRIYYDGSVYTDKIFKY